MLDKNNTSSNRAIRRLKIYLWILLPILLFLTILFAEIENMLWAFIISLVVAFVDTSLIYFFSKRFYNWPMIFLFVFAVGILFKRNHWPLGGAILTASTYFIVIISIVNTIRFQSRFSHNQFLRWFGSLSCFVAALFLSGFLFRIQHWPREIGDFMGYSGSLLFLISILALVFLLPNSNYVSWSGYDRKIFYRVIILPMVFLFVFMSIVYVFEDAFRMMLNVDYSSIPWQRGGAIKLFDLEGIPSIIF